MSTSDTARLTAVVHGRVQGVGYRMFAVAQARALGLDGYVRNLPDGRTVEVVAEGARSTLDELLLRLQRGPRGAHVERVDTAWSAASGGFGSFETRY